MVLVFRNRAIADTILKEIAATPQIEDGIGPVWVWFNPDEDATVIGYKEGADGRCAIAHPWSQVDREWLEAYLADWIASGDVQVLDALPGDWQYQEMI